MCKYNSFLYMLLIFLSPCIAFSSEISGIKLIGNTIDLDLDTLLAEKRGDFSNKELESISVLITNIYHRRGYTTSFVERLIVRKDGVLEVYIKESRILRIEIRGTDNPDKTRIKSLLQSLSGEVYNKIVVQSMVRRIRGVIGLKRVRIMVHNYRNTGDVFLVLNIDRGRRGNIYGGIGFDYIYGLSPVIAYFYPFEDSAISMTAGAGYRDGIFKKVDCGLKYYLFLVKKNRPGFYVGTNYTRLIERWEGVGRDYRAISVSPSVGIKYKYSFLLFDLYINEILTMLYNYRDEEFLNCDTRFTADFYISNKLYLIRKKEATWLKLSFSSGTSEIEREYLNTAMDFKTSASPVVWMRLIPRFNIFYTTSDERYMWDYIYDSNLLGFFGDFTASNWKNIIGLNLEFELSPELLYLGPFINSGYFRDEYNKWKTKTGVGALGEIMYGNFILKIHYAWDIMSAPLKGGLYITANSSF